VTIVPSSRLHLSAAIAPGAKTHLVLEWDASGGIPGIDYYVHERVRDFLARRHKMHGRGTRRYSYEVVDGERGVLRPGHVR
jgi:hypothetical protein